MVPSIASCEVKYEPPKVASQGGLTSCPQGIAMNAGAGIVGKL